MTAGDFLRNLYTDINAAEDRAKAFQAQAIGTQSAGLVTIQRVESTLPDGESYGRLKGFATADQDYVLCLEMRGGGTVVLGPLQNTAPTGYTLDAPLTANVVSSDTLSYVVSASAAVVATTTATATYQNAYTLTITLPAGTWTVNALGWLSVMHSATANANLWITINGSTVVGARNTPTNATTYQVGMCHQQVTGITGGGTIDIVLQYKGSAAGTTSATNPALMLNLQRTA